MIYYDKDGKCYTRADIVKRWAYELSKELDAPIDDIGVFYDAYSDTAVGVEICENGYDGYNYGRSGKDEACTIKIKEVPQCTD